MRGKSIRFRLTCWYAVVLVLAFSVFGAGMWWALESRLISGVDAHLEQRIRGTDAVLKAERRPGNRAHLQQELTELADETQDGTLIQLFDPEGVGILPNPRQPLLPRNDAARGAYTARIGRKSYRVLTRQLQNADVTYAALVAAPLDEVRAVMRDLRELLLLLIPAAILLACAGGYWLSMSELRPVDEITSVARSINLHNLSSRVPVPRTGDELQRMAETWNEVLERLDSAVKRVRQFTADASHELRTPLALIRATAELALRRERDTAEYRRSLQEIESQAEQMTVLTESMLTIARADFEGVDVQMSNTDLNEVAIEQVRQHQPGAAAKGILLRAADGCPNSVVRANAQALHRLLRILIDNAVRHTPAGGTITVSTSQLEGSAVLSVEDTGEGIQPDDLPHIFERFYRVDRARSSGSGFGLGLSIAQTIAQAHGAQLAASSPDGAGARFAVVFPPVGGHCPLQAP